MPLIVKSDVYLNARSRCTRELAHSSMTFEELKAIDGNPVRVAEMVLIDAIAEIDDAYKRRWRFAEAGFGTVVNVDDAIEWSRNILMGFNVDKVQNLLDISDLIGNDVRNGLLLKQAFENSKSGPLSRADAIAVSRAFGLLQSDDLFGMLITVPGFESFVSKVIFQDITNNDVLMDAEKIKKIIELVEVFDMDYQQRALLVSNTARSIYPYSLESMSTDRILNGLECYLGKFPWWLDFKYHVKSIEFIEKLDFRSSTQVQNHMLATSESLDNISLPTSLGM